MNGDTHRRMRNESGKPLVRTSFGLFPVKSDDTALCPNALDGEFRISPFVELVSLEGINQVFDDVHAGKVQHRVVLVPGMAT